MKRVTALLKAGAFVIASGVIAAGVTVSSARANTYDLEFLLDSSGSIGSTNWSAATAALASALDAIPTSGPDQYKVGVISFSSTAVSVVAPTIVTAANLASIKALITGASFLNSTTCMSCAFNAVAALGSLGDLSLINMTTDGVPDSQSATNTAVAAAAAAGWDGLSVEAIGSGVDITYLTSIAFPTPVVNDGTIPDPRTHGFVLPVANFTDYGDAIAAKVQAVVNPTPLPGAIPLFATGLGVFGLLGWRRKRKGAGVLAAA